jgi:hypothetical protein
MSSGCLLEKIIELKEKFKNCFVHKKKIRALENYSEVAPFAEKEYLQLIKKCAKDRFLSQKAADFLCELIEQYDVNFLDWSHKTRWLKKEMKRLEEVHKKATYVQMNFFDFDKVRPHEQYKVPFEVLEQQQRKQMRARV